MVEIAIVGAGMAGTACARALVEAGHEPVLIDKGRSVGGRLAQRRTPVATFDHGAQYMRAHDPEFAAACARWAEAGLVVPWSAAGENAWIGRPGMNAPVHAMIGELSVWSGRRVVSLPRILDSGRDRWLLPDDQGRQHGPFDVLVLALPADQITPLLERANIETVAARLRDVAMAPCWAALAAFAQPLSVEGEVVRGDGAIAWAARNQGKPGRESPDGGAVDAWTIHASPAWSRAHLEDTPEAVAAALLAQLGAFLGVSVPDPIHLEAHRWRYALVERPLGERFLLDPERGLGLCGDWCLGPRVEAAWQSGTALGRAVAQLA